ncbi:lectin-like [Carassius carassius]|uniref:lectin-like n=1 Tax=Carassius carassius TaxID=217509 RepID=UPI0028688B89|nr:lectin-like [Carassius carassius]
MESFSFLLVTLLLGHCSVLTIERDEAAGHTSLSSGCVLPKQCPLTGYEDWYRVGSRCVRYFGSPLNFSDAEYSCRNQAPGGHLVSVHNSEANDDLLCIVIRYNPQNLRIWIGGFEFFQSGRFIWTDGSSWNYQTWTPGEPNNYNSREDCVEMNFNHVGKWNDLACHDKQNYICGFKVKTSLTQTLGLD